MKKAKSTVKKNTEAELLELLKRVLPKATHDAQLAVVIYQAVETELRTTARVVAFDKYCEKLELPNLEPKSIDAVKMQLAASFGDGDITVKPDAEEQALAIEIALPDGHQFTGAVKVRATDAGAGDDQEIVLKFVPFPVVLPGDQELVWFLAKRENMTPDEAGIALAKVEEEFWASKSGQKLLRDRVDRTFPEFIQRVPAGMMNELGLKRHYKTPEAIKVMRSLPPK